MATNRFYSCPADCDEALLFPALPQDPYCTLAPDYSQVAALFIAPCESEDPFVFNPYVPPVVDPPAAAIPANVGLSSTAIDNTNTDNTTPRQIVVQGSVSEHEPTIYDGPFRRQLISNRAYTLEFIIPIPDQATYEFLRSLQCNPRFRFWYQDIADWLHGPVAEATDDDLGGIIPTLVNVQMPKGGGRDDLQTATIILSWDAPRSGEPPRWKSPLPYTISCQPAEV